MGSHHSHHHPPPPPPPPPNYSQGEISGPDAESRCTTMQHERGLTHNYAYCASNDTHYCGGICTGTQSCPTDSGLRYNACRGPPSNVACTASDCNNHGTASGTRPDCTCSCKGKWSGATCETAPLVCPADGTEHGCPSETITEVTSPWNVTQKAYQHGDTIGTSKPTVGTLLFNQSQPIPSGDPYTYTFSGQRANTDGTNVYDSNVCSTTGSGSGPSTCSIVENIKKYDGTSSGPRQSVQLETFSTQHTTPDQCYDMSGIVRKGPPAGKGVQSCVSAAKADKNALLLLMKQETSNWGAGGRPASATRPQLSCSWLSASEIQQAKLNPKPCVDDLIHIKYGDNKTIQVGTSKFAGYLLPGRSAAAEAKVSGATSKAKATRDYNTFADSVAPALIAMLPIALVLDNTSLINKIRAYQNVFDKLSVRVGVQDTQNFSNSVTAYFIALQDSVGGNYVLGQILEDWWEGIPFNTTRIDDAQDLLTLVQTLYDLIDEGKKENPTAFAQVSALIKEQDPNLAARAQAAATQRTGSAIANYSSAVIQSLAKEYNMYTSTYNQALSALQNAGTLKQLRNKKMRGQIKRLGRIQDTISTRDRLIQINQEQAVVNDGRIRTLRKVYIPIVVSIVIYILMMTKKINGVLGLSLITITFVGFGVYLLWQLNALGVKKAISPELEVIRSLTEQGGRAINREAGRLQTQLAQYVNKNCDCPKKKKKKKVKIGDEGGGYVYVDEGGFYYDGTAPVQELTESGRLKPLKTGEQKPLRYGIDWETSPEFGQIRSRILHR